METLRGDQTAELSAKREKGWRCFPDQASLLSQAQVITKSVAVGLVGETFLRVPDNADSNDRSVWLAWRNDGK